MTPLDLEALKKLCEAATPGPWEVFPFVEGQKLSVLKVVDSGIGRGMAFDVVRLPFELDMFRNANFIAAARTEMPKLIEEVEKHRQDLADAMTDFPVGIPEPGSELAVLMRANVLMRRENQSLRDENKRMRGACLTEKGLDSLKYVTELRELLREAAFEVQAGRAPIGQVKQEKLDLLKRIDAALGDK